MKKRIFAVLCVMTMAISLLAGCGGQSSTDSSTDSDSASSSAPTNFPKNNITVVVPYGAGGTTDLSTRALLEVAGNALPSGVNFVVENVGGSAGMVGVQQVLNSKADGYTLVAMSCDLPLNRALGVTDVVAEEALIPICRTQFEPYAIIVRADSEIQSLEDMVAKAQSAPEALSVGITGIGTGNGLACLAIQDYFGCTLKLVPFDSAADAMVATVNGQVDMTINSAVSAAGQVEAGELKIIGVTANEKSPTMPGVPALGEAYDVAKDMAVYSWICLCAPAGTPDDVVEYLRTVLNDACESSEYAELVKGFYMTPQPLDPDQIGTFFNDQYEYYVKCLEGQKF